MSIERKKTVLKAFSLVFVTLTVAALLLAFYALSPLHPQNITDETVINRGVEYTVRLSGISKYDENGFVPVADGFSFSDGKLFVYEDADGFARTTDEGKVDSYVLGRYNSGRISYEDYSFCGESYKNQQELEAFFEEPDRIYDFDIDKLSDYIQDVINFKRRFYGKMTVKIYKGRLVVAEVYIYNEKVLELKK